MNDMEKTYKLEFTTTELTNLNEALYEYTFGLQRKVSNLTWIRDRILNVMKDKKQDNIRENEND